MSARAQARIRAEEERERARQDAEWAAEDAERAAMVEAMRPAEPFEGCAECWQWRDGWPWAEPWWQHGESVQPGPAPADQPFWGPGTRDTDWCWHACHGEDGPVFCGPVAMAGLKTAARDRLARARVSSRWTGGEGSGKCGINGTTGLPPPAPAPVARPARPLSQRYR